MADKILKSLQFPGLEDTYIIPEQIGKKGDSDNSIILNDLENNEVLTEYSTVAGANNKVGVFGYKMLNVSPISEIEFDITVEDSSIENKAIDNYANGDILCFDGKSHYYNNLIISSISSNNEGNSVIKVTAKENKVLQQVEMSDEDFDGSRNWVFVAEKPYIGIPAFSSSSATAYGNNNVVIGHGAFAIGSQNTVIGDDGFAAGRENTVLYSAYAEGILNEATGDASHVEGTHSKASGTRAHAEGYSTTASGNMSHAEGAETIASGPNSHAEGDNTQANALGSHAEGVKAIADGNASHAEGGTTHAKGPYSHAEGNKTTAEGAYSHTEGNNTTASKSAAHSEGEGSIASGAYSHAEGYHATANGTASHAEGRDTFANGYGAHAEGRGTIANGDQQHVQGKWNIEDTSNKYAHIVGGGTKNDNRLNIHTLDWSGHAWFAGDVFVGPDKERLAKASEISSQIDGIWEGEGEGALVFNTENNVASGKYSIAQGIDNRASEVASHAEGSCTFASGFGAHAEGSLTEAKGSYSHAEGNQYFDSYGTPISRDVQIAEDDTIRIGGSAAFGEASHAEGIGTLAYGRSSHSEGGMTDAMGEFSHAEGWKAQALGAYSHAAGYETKAEGNISHAEGRTTQALGSNSHAEGLSTIASGTQSHAEGNQTKATGNNSHAEGALSEANTVYSHAEGYNSIAGQINEDGSAIGTISHAEGRLTKAIGNNSHSEGNETIASGNNSHAEGVGTKASGNNSHAEGNYSSSYGNSAHAEGSSTSASGEFAHAEGYGAFARGWCSHAEGSNTVAYGMQSHAENGGSAYGDSSHAEGSSIAQGNASHAEGSQTTAEGNYSHSEGIQSKAIGSASHAEGGTTEANGAYSHAEGNKTKALKPYSHSEGNQTEAQGNASHAEGEKSIAISNYSHAEGYGSVAGKSVENADGTITVSGTISHAEGRLTVASGNNSHAEGNSTIAAGGNQHAQGKYNIEDTVNKYAHIVGNGTSDANRSNAHTLDWNGNAWFAGDVFVGAEAYKLAKSTTIRVWDCNEATENGWYYTEYDFEDDITPANIPVEYDENIHIADEYYNGILIVAGGKQDFYSDDGKHWERWGKGNWIRKHELTGFIQNTGSWDVTGRATGFYYGRIPELGHYCMGLHIARSMEDCIQIVWTIEENPKQYVRSGLFDTAITVWGDWTEIGSTAAVTSVNGQTGAVNLTASDIGAIPQQCTYVNTVVSADTITAPFVLLNISSENAELRTLLGNANYAYLQTQYYSANPGYRMQIAYSYAINPAKMAFRTEYQGVWSAWTSPSDGVSPAAYVEQEGSASTTLGYGSNSISFIYRYRLWSNGVAEVFGTSAKFDVILGSSWGALLESTYQIEFSDYPIVFTEVHHCNASFITDVGNNIAIVEGISPTSDINTNPGRTWLFRGGDTGTHIQTSGYMTTYTVGKWR